jgi:hypothetical protein
MKIFEDIKTKILLLEGKAKLELHTLVLRAEAVAKTQKIIYGIGGLAIGFICGFILRG